MKIYGLTKEQEFVIDSVKKQLMDALSILDAANCITESDECFEDSIELYSAIQVSLSCCFSMEQSNNTYMYIKNNMSSSYGSSSGSTQGSI